MLKSYIFTALSIALAFFVFFFLSGFIFTGSMIQQPTIKLIVGTNSVEYDFGGKIVDGLILTARTERQLVPSLTTPPAPLLQPLCGLVQVKTEWKLSNVQPLPTPIAPAIGYWVKIGDKNYRTGENGIFTIREQPNQEKGYVYKEITDEHPIWEFPISSLTSNCDSPTLVIVELEVESLSQMDGQHISLQFHLPIINHRMCEKSEGLA